MRPHPAAQQRHVERGELVPEQPQQNSATWRDVLPLLAHRVVREQLNHPPVEFGRHPVLYGRELKLQAQFEGGPSYLSFKVQTLTPSMYKGYIGDI